MFCTLFLLATSILLVRSTDSEIEHFDFDDDAEAGLNSLNNKQKQNLVGDSTRLDVDTSEAESDESDRFQFEDYEYKDYLNDIDYMDSDYYDYSELQYCQDVQFQQIPGKITYEYYESLSLGSAKECAFACAQDPKCLSAIFDRYVGCDLSNKTLVNNPEVFEEIHDDILYIHDINCVEHDNGVVGSDTVVPSFDLHQDSEFKCGLGAKPSRNNQMVANSEGNFRPVVDEESVTNAWPWVVSLILNDEHRCAGNLLRASTSNHSTDVVITDAICLEMFMPGVAKNIKPELLHHLKVRSGDHHFWVHEFTTQTAGVEKVLVNEENFLAILILSNPIKFREGSSGICVPGESNKPKPGTRCFVAGWNFKRGSEYEQYEVLHETIVPILNNTECGLNKSDQKSLCVGSKRAEAILGDPGSPLMCNIGPFSKYFLQGVFQYKADFNKPDTVISVSDQCHWINGVICNESQIIGHDTERFCNENTRCHK